MINQSLVSLANSVLGTGKATARGNYAYHCPLCHHAKPKLEINMTENTNGENAWHCWVCDKKGKKLYQLFKAVEVSPEIMAELKAIVKYTGPETDVKVEEKLKLPKEFQPLTNIQKSNIIGRHALAYLKSRGITEEDILKYGIGYCETGRYANMVIIPSFDAKGNINYFTGRSFEKEPSVKYRNPTVSRDIIPFELFINWAEPIILCEGSFDAIAIKRNAIPLFGKIIQPALQKKIIQERVRYIYIFLDADALKNAIQIAERFMAEGLNVYFIELQNEDAAELGFQRINEIIQDTDVLTFERLMQLKMGMIWT